MRAEGLDHVLMMDSDTLLYASALEIHNAMHGRDCSFSMPLDDHLPLPPSFVYVSRNALEDFVMFAEKLISWTSSRTGDASPNDMRIFALYTYSAEDMSSPRRPTNMRDAGVHRAILRGSLPRPKFRICNMNNMSIGSERWIFDKNLAFSSSRTFKMMPRERSVGDLQTVKEIHMGGSETISNLFFTLSGGERVRVGGIHFQGGKKRFMARFLTKPATYSACRRQRRISSKGPAGNNTNLQKFPHNFPVCACRDLACQNCLNVVCEGLHGKKPSN